MQNSGLTLNLGSGKDYKPDCVNADIRADVGADWVVDIGAFMQIDRQFDRILAFDVLEHIPNLVQAMTNCRDLLRDGGEMHIHVPYELSLGAWQDPTHVRAFNEKSWLYYTDWHWYLGWEDRFYMTHLEFRLNPLTQDLKLTQEELLRTPRAIDSMYCVLQKGKK